MAACSLIEALFSMCRPDPSSRSSLHLVRPIAVVLDGTLYFGASDGIDGYELWQSDGTEAGTSMMGDINPGQADSIPQALIPLPSPCSSILFSATEPTLGREPWMLHQALAPGLVGGVAVAKDVPAAGFTRVDWTSLDPVAGVETTYDVVRGVLSLLHTGGPPGGAVCVADSIADTPFIELPGGCTPAPGDGCWYLVRAQNGCGTGAFGTPALDSSSPCP